MKAESPMSGIMVEKGAGFFVLRPISTSPAHLSAGEPIVVGEAHVVTAVSAVARVARVERAQGRGHHLWPRRARFRRRRASACYPGAAAWRGDKPLPVAVAVGTT